MLIRTLHQLSSVQSLSRVRLFATPWTAALQASLSITNSWSLLKLMSIESAIPSNHLILVIPFSSRLQSFPASESFQTSPLKWPKYWSFSFTISPSSEYSGLISLQSKNSQESSPTLQFKSINSSVLSFLYSPTLTSIHDYWKKHSFE